MGSGEGVQPRTISGRDQFHYSLRLVGCRHVNGNSKRNSKDEFSFIHIYLFSPNYTL